MTGPKKAGRSKARRTVQAALPSIRHLKPFVGGRVFALQPDVFSNCLIRDVPTACHEIAPSPQMAPPKLLPQPPIVHQQPMRRLPLDRLHHATTVNIKGESYRRRAKKKAGLLGRRTKAATADAEASA